MTLPLGISYNPRQQTLIGERDALITIDRGSVGNKDYAIEETFVDASLERSFKGDWERFDLLFGIKRMQKSGEREVPMPAWSIARHQGVPRKPQITVVPNLPTSLANVPSDHEAGFAAHYTAFGSDFGRWIPTESAYAIRNVYEFQSPGIAVIDRELGEVDLWVARKGDKIAVPAGSHVTLYNIADHDQPLVVLSFDDGNAAPQRDPLSAALGPILLGYYDDLEVIFVVNHLHINRERGGGVRIPADVPDSMRTIRISKMSRQDLGSFLYEQFTLNSSLVAQFAKLGVNVRLAPFDAVLEPLPKGLGDAKKLFFSRPLAEAVVAKGALNQRDSGTGVYRYFFPGFEKPKPEPRIAWTRPSPPETELAAPPKPVGRPLVFVVEGAGDWVEKAYRPRFLEAGSDKVSVFYADDSRWTRKRPIWLDDLKPWETYLDKAMPDEFLRYSLLRPDAVFVVTPDFLHATMAASWLGKTPLVFVEKPFDSDLRRVEGLQLTAHARRTEIIGLDHYQHYVAPLWELREQIVRIVGHSLSRVVFVLTENRPIEEGRERSLQHGLTLDLLPHFLALLTFFGDISTIDEITVPKALRYIEAKDAPAEPGEEKFTMQNETGSVVDFTFEDISGNGHRVPCRAIIGKGFRENVKYMEVTGAGGGSLRIDLNEKATNESSPDYCWNSVFFLSENEPHVTIPDPYRPAHLLWVVTEDGKKIRRDLDRTRYGKLLDDLLGGTNIAAASSLSMSQGGHIVHVLDRIWWAVQNAKPWYRHELKKLDPIDLLRQFE